MPTSFSELLVQLQNNPLLARSVLLIFAVLLVNGWTDAPNAITGVVVTGALPFHASVLLAAVCNFLGVLFVTSVNASVTETVYSIVSFRGGASAALVALCAAMLSIVLWATAAWFLGIPTSESHALVAGLSGAAVALEGTFACIRWTYWARVLWGLTFSSIIGFMGAFLIQRRLKGRQFPSCIRRAAQISGAAGLSFFHGAQDGQKFLGMFLLCFSLAQGYGDQQPRYIPPLYLILCAAFIALGTLMGGRRIINKIGREMVSLRSEEGFSADLSSILTLFFATVLGFPVSTTHTRTTALLGAGLSGTGTASIKTVFQIILIWLFTFPACMTIGFLMTKLFLKLMQ